MTPIKDFFNSLAGNIHNTITIDSINIAAYSDADLLAFNGHDGLMDTEINRIVNSDSIPKDAVVIACISAEFFT